MTTPRRNSNAQKIPTKTPRGQFSSERQKSGLQRSALDSTEQKRSNIDSDSTNEFINFLSTSSKTPEEIIAIQDEEIARLKDRIRILESKENTVMLIDRESLDNLKKMLQSETHLRQEMEKENEVLKKELVQIRKTVLDLEDKLSRRKVKENESKDELLELNSELEKLRINIEDLQDKLSMERKNGEILKDQIVEFNREIQNLEDKNNDLKTDKIKLSAENIRLNEILSEQTSSFEEEIKFERSKTIEALKKNLGSELSVKEAIEKKNEILTKEVEKLNSILQDQAEKLLNKSRKDSEEQIEFLRRCIQELEDENEKLKTETVKQSTQITKLNETISNQTHAFEEELKTIKQNTSTEYLELLTEEKKKNETLMKQLMDKDFDFENFKSNVDMKTAVFEGKEKELKEQLVERQTKITSLQNQSSMLQQELVQKDRLLREKIAQEAADETSKRLVSEINVGDDASALYQSSALKVKYSAIFENEWKDALAENKTGQGDQQAIKNLFDIIKDAHDFCNKKVLDLTRDLLKTFEPFKIGANALPPDLSKVMNNYKKSISVHLVGSLQKIFVNESYFVGPETEKYKQKCIEVCWLMKIHDPPIIIDTKIPFGRFDGNKYQAYTKNGKDYKYLVWPAAYLHRGGPVLCKGVAEVE